MRNIYHHLLFFIFSVSISPEPKIAWYRDDENIEESDKYVFNRETLGTCHLTIRALEIIDQVFILIFIIFILLYKYIVIFILFKLNKIGWMQLKLLHLLYVLPLILFLMIKTFFFS